jgi:hypothetical protein
MADVEVLLQSPDAETLASELAAAIGTEGAVNARRLPTRGGDVVTVISVASATLTAANILLQWYASVRSRKQRLHCTLKINGRPIDIDLPDHKAIKALFK